MKERGNFPQTNGRSSAGRDTQYLTAFIIAAGGANPMRHIRRGALRADTQLRQLQHAVVSTAHALPAVRWFAFWNTHNKNSQF
jgi:hypothetical protein